MSDVTITHSGGTIAPTAVDQYQAQRPSRSIGHQIINAADIDVTFRPAGLRSGSCLLVFAVAADADAAVDALAVPQTFVFESVTRPGLNMSFVIVDGAAPALAPGVAGETTVSLPFQEVAT